VNPTTHDAQPGRATYAGQHVTLPTDTAPAEGIGVREGAWRSAPPLDWAGDVDLGWSWRRVAVPVASTATAVTLTALAAFGAGLWAAAIAALGTTAAVVGLAFRFPE
jgi:hypothetical protein